MHDDAWGRVLGLRQKFQNGNEPVPDECQRGNHLVQVADHLNEEGMWATPRHWKINFSLVGAGRKDETGMVLLGWLILLGFSQGKSRQSLIRSPERFGCSHHHK